MPIAKALDKIQHLLMRNTLNKLGTEEMNFNIIKSFIIKPTGNFMLSRRKAEIVSSKIRNKTGHPFHFHSV
jgi:hypothetical protein